MLKFHLDIHKKIKLSENDDLETLTSRVCAAVSSFLEAPEAWQGKTLSFTARFSDDAEVQELNRTYRGKDKPTNVLSFPSGEDFPHMDLDGEKYIGDIIISCDTLEKEAHEQNKTVDNHLKHLLVHSILHLYGFDHMEDAEAEEMEALEVDILKALGVANPYEV